MMPAALVLVALAAVEEVTAYPVVDPPPTKAEAPATTPHADDDATNKGPSFTGYLLPTFGMTYFPGALPKYSWFYGMQNTAAGLGLEQEVLPGVGYTLNAELNVDSLQFEEATLYYSPISAVKLKAGRMNVPFTLESTAIVTKRLFPERAAPTVFFLAGTDLGLLGELKIRDDLVVLHAGVFNGNGVAIGEGKDRGRMYALRVDVSPWGAVPNVDTKHEGLRAGVGGSVVYYPSVVFDTAGFVSSHARDGRLDLSLTLAFMGLAFQAEYMRRQRSDSVTDLVDLASGWYAQTSYFYQLTKMFGVSPIARFGTMRWDQAFVPRNARWVEAGTSLYVAKGDKPAGGGKLTVIYSGQFLPINGVVAHGATLQYLLTF